MIDITNNNISIIVKQLPQKDWMWAEEKIKKEKSSIDYKSALINFTENEITERGFDVIFYKTNILEKFIKNMKKNIKYFFSVNNDNDKKEKYIYICGIKFKIKDLK